VTLLVSGLILGVVLWIGADEGRFGLSAQDWVRTQRARITFNRVYSSGNPPFNTTPSQFLVYAVQNLKPGAALDIAAGQGRNSVFLAQQGWQVTAFDISQKGLEAAQRNAKTAGVSITTVQSSAAKFDYGRDRWDLILLSYAPIAFHDAALMQRIADSLKPGGRLIVNNPVMRYGSPNQPKSPGELDPGELRQTFPGLRVVESTEVNQATEWFHTTMPIAKMIAEKPAR
jgi:SAM-dependent methyltransferase